MTQKELYKLLKSTGLPVAYHHFKEAVQPPFIAYYKTDSDNIVADNIAYVKRSNYVIELYTDVKDIELEARLEELLDSKEICYDANETYIESEAMYAAAYNIQI